MEPGSQRVRGRTRSVTFHLERTGELGQVKPATPQRSHASRERLQGKSDLVCLLRVLAHRLSVREATAFVTPS